MAFDPQGKTTAYWCSTSPTSKTAPTIAQITAGVRLDTTLVPDGVTGFTSAPGFTDSTALADTVEQKVPSLSTVQEGKLVLKAPQKSGDPEKTVFNGFTVGDAGCLVICLDGTPTAGDLCHVFETEVANISVDDRTGKKLATYTVDFAPGLIHNYSVVAA